MSFARQSDPFSDGSAYAASPDMSMAYPGTRTTTPMTAATQPTRNDPTAPALSGASASGDARTRQPWYLRTTCIIAFIVLLLAILALGIGLGVGLNNNDSDPSNLAAQNNSNGSSITSTVYSTNTVEMSQAPSTIIQPEIVTARAVETSTLVRTMGGSTLISTITQTGAAGAQITVRVSQTVDPSTSTQTVTRQIIAGTSTVTEVLAGGGTVTLTSTYLRTVTATAARRERRAKWF